jgi:hypothetical protein
VSLFCEDIRQEKSNVDTLIGIFPDNISVAQTPGVMPKCCLYVRGHFPVAHPPAKVEVRLAVPWEAHTIHLGQIEAPVIHAAVANAKEKEDRWIGLIFKAQFLNFPIPQPGRIFVIVSTGTKEFLTGTLRVVTDAQAYRCKES